MPCPAKSVTTENPAPLDGILHRARDIADAIAGARLRDSRVQASRGLHSAACVTRSGTVPDRDGARRVAVKTFVHDAEVEADDIAGFQFAARRDAVNDFVVNRHAQAFADTRRRPACSL